jgi:tryptophan-rich sensory protein
MRNPEPLSNPEAALAAESSVLRHAALILWPSFLAACLLEVLVFALVDPGEVHWFGQMPQPSRQSVYSVAFFLFWLITMACSGMVLWLARSEQNINAQSAQALTDTSVD